VISRKKFLIVLVGPSGAGKSSICKRVLKESKSIVFSVSFTTRKKRLSEVNGKDYFFVNEKKFKAMQKAGDFLESAFVHNSYYGTSKKFISDRLSQGKCTLLDIDVQGAKIILNSKDFEMVTIFIMPPTVKILLDRLHMRGDSSKADLNIRIESMKKELKEISRFDYLVINDNIDLATKRVQAIIEAEECKVARQKNIKF